jgi:tetratricopeptide (TPR) repeat protein
MMRHVFSLPSAKLGVAGFALAACLLAGCSSSEEKAQRYYEHGKELLAAKDYDRAEVEFRNAVQLNKRLLPAWRDLAQVEELTHKWGALVPALRNVLELDPNDMATRLKLGRLLLIGGGVDDALKLVNEVKAPDDQNADLLALKAAILLKLKDFDGAVSQAQAALKLDPANTGALFVLAADDFAKGNLKAALAILNNDAMAKRNDIGVSLFKLQILEKSQDLPESEALLKKLVDLYPKETGFKSELIRLYLFQHRNDDAEQVQRAIVADNPSDVQAHLALIRLLAATKGPAAAEQEAQALVKAGGDVFRYQLSLAQLNVAQGKADDAIALLNKLISSESSTDNAQMARINLAETYMSQKKLDAAAAVVADILKTDARNISGLKLRAGMRIDGGQLEGAIADLRQALNDQPRATDLMLMLAIAYERNGSIDLADKEFADAVRVSNVNPQVTLNYTAFLQRRGNLSHAEDVLTDLAGRWPQNVEVLSALAQVRLARQEWAGAQEVAQIIKRIGSNPVLGDELLGAALAGSNKNDESIVALQNAYQAQPNATQPMNALVRAYLRAQKPDQAIGFLQSVLKASPSNAEAYVLLGSVQLGTKSPDEARKSFMAAIEKQPTNVVGYRALADYYIAQKNYDEALKVTNAGLKRQPNNFALHLALADILERSGNYDGAIAEYENLLNEDSGSMVVANNLASLLADHRSDKPSLDRAVQLATMLQKSPLPQFKDTLGWVKYREGDYKAALPLLDDAATALPNALVHYHLGMTYLATGQAGKAAEQFKTALAQPLADPGLADEIRAALAKTGTQ